MNKTTITLKQISLAALLATAILLTSCSGDDGAVGPTGKDGATGTAGTNGTNGVGLEESLSRGNIILILDGIRNDGKPFKDTLDFRYAPYELDYSKLYRRAPGTDHKNDVSLGRYLSWDGVGNQWESRASNTIYIETQAEYDDSNKLTRLFMHFQLYNTSIKSPENNQWFYVGTNFFSDFYYDENGALTDNTTGPITNIAITNYQRVIGTDGKFNNKLTFTVPEPDNTTGADLNVTVVTDVTIAETIDNK